MRFTVGGEEFDLTRERVVSAMKGVPSEPVQKHQVEIDGTVYPPKQVFGTVTGRTRTSFTTMEAQRVLSRLGFEPRRADADDGSTSTDTVPVTTEDRVRSIETELAVLRAAVAGLEGRVSTLEAG